MPVNSVDNFFACPAFPVVINAPIELLIVY